MKIIIESEPKEVAALILAIQERQIPKNVLELAEYVGDSLKANQFGHSEIKTCFQDKAKHLCSSGHSTGV